MKAQNLHLLNLVQYQDNAIVSKRILENSAGGITLFAFDKEQRLSEHTAPFDATIQILEGSAEIFIDSKPHTVNAGEAIIMPAKIPHAVYAKGPFKMMLIMIRGQ